MGNTEGPPKEDLVRCLACGRVYALPVRGGVEGAAGCTECGAVSWIAVAIPTREPPRPTPGVRPAAPLEGDRKFPGLPAFR